MPRGDGLKGMATTISQKELIRETRERREAARAFKILDRIRKRVGTRRIKER